MSPRKSKFASPAKSEELFLENYDLMSELGDGAYSRVHLVENVEGDEFAVKICRGNSSTASTIGEYYMLKQLDHPNIVKVVDLYTNESRTKVYLLMEYLDGYTDFSSEMPKLNEGELV